MISEKEIRDCIERLEQKLQHNADYYRTCPIELTNRVLVDSLSIESMLDALHFVLEEKYEYKYK